MTSNKSVLVNTKQRFSQSVKKNTLHKQIDSTAEAQRKIAVIWQDNQSGDFLKLVMEISL
jgi:hypothetical protein